MKEEGGPSKPGASARTLGARANIDLPMNERTKR
jgi:hypothetical protein